MNEQYEIDLFNYFQHKWQDLQMHQTLAVKNKATKINRLSGDHSSFDEKVEKYLTHNP